MIDKIPGKEFLQGSLPVDIKSGVQGGFFKGPGPVPSIKMGHAQQIDNPAISPGKQGLEVRPAWNVRVQADVRHRL